MSLKKRRLVTVTEEQIAMVALAIDDEFDACQQLYAMAIEEALSDIGPVEIYLNSQKLPEYIRAKGGSIYIPSSSAMYRMYMFRSYCAFHPESPRKLFRFYLNLAYA